MKPNQYTAVVISLIGVSGLVAVYCGYIISGLDLWGWWTMPLLTSAWLCLSLILQFFLFKNKDYRLYGLSFLSGLIMGLGFLPGFTPFLIFAGFVPLLVLIDKNEDRLKKRTILWYLFNAFVWWNTISTFWVSNSLLAGGLFANYANSMLMCLPWIIYLVSRKNLPERFSLLLLVVSWISFEYIHLHWEISWPWLNLGNAFGMAHKYVQWYEYTGAFGGTLWALLGNLLVFRCFKNRDSLRKPAWIASAAVVFLVLPVVSMLIYRSVADRGRLIEVAIVQPNYEPHYQKFTIPQDIQFDKYAALSRQILTDTTSILLFPETSFDFIRFDRFDENYIVARWRDFLKNYQKTSIVSGFDAIRYYPQKIENEPALRTRDNGMGPEYFTLINGAAMIQVQKELPPQTYNKSLFVPGAEIFPYRDLLFFLKPLVRSLGGSMAGYQTQQERSVFVKGDIKIAPAICYESIYGEYMGRFVLNGSNLLSIMTNDGWWGDTPGYRQHCYYGALRAIESRRSIIRSANTGISCFINQRGDLIQPMPYETDAAIRDQVALNNDLTFYTRYGDYLAKMSVGILAIMVAVVIFLSLKSRKANTRPNLNPSLKAGI